MAHATPAGWLLRALLFEKVVQHAVVTWALLVDAGGIRDEVVVDYRWLAVIGACVGALFAVALSAHFAGQRWSLPLAMSLAAIDIVGEFVAQGTLNNTVTFSLIVAIAIVVLAFREVRRADARTT